jgi:hypothetical protein
LKTFAHEVIISGGHTAGLRAAFAAAELESEIEVAAILKVYSIHTHSVCASILTKKLEKIQSTIGKLTYLQKPIKLVETSGKICS